MIRSAVHFFQRGSGRFPKYASLLFAIMAALLSLAALMSAEKLSLPTESSKKICSQLLTTEERRAYERIRHGNGYTLLTIDCPVGSFETSQRVMMNDLFWVTRGEYFDVAWSAERAADWLQQGVDKLVYLENDTSASFGIGRWRAYVESAKSDSSEAALYNKLSGIFQVESLEKLRELAQSCKSLEVPIRDPQGPLV